MIFQWENVGVELENEDVDYERLLVWMRGVILQLIIHPHCELFISFPSQLFTPPPADYSSSQQFGGPGKRLYLPTYFPAFTGTHCRLYARRDGQVDLGGWLKVRVRLNDTELRDVTCHMGSHGVTCHPTQVNAPRLNPSPGWLAHSINLPGKDG